MSTVASAIRQDREVLASAIRQQRNKSHPNCQGKIEDSLFTDNIKFYEENPKDSTKKFLIREFSKGAGYKTNVQKSVAFLYTNNDASEREIKNGSHLQLHQKL